MVAKLTFKVFIVLVFVVILYHLYTVVGGDSCLVYTPLLQVLPLGIMAVHNDTVIQYSRGQLFNLRLAPRQLIAPTHEVLTTLKLYGILNYRGKRAGALRTRIRDTNKGVHMCNLTQIQTTSDNILNTHEAVNRQLHICCFNTRSVKNKAISLCDFIHSNDFDIVALTETWLGTCVDGTCIEELVPSGYKINHVPRKDGRRGGGIAIICKNSIDLSIISSSNDSEFLNFEYMDCNIVTKGFSMRLATIYRPPP